VARRNQTADNISQKMHPVSRERKKELLAHLIRKGDWHQVLVFTRMKHGANRLTDFLNDQGISAMAIHGNKSQTARTKALADFKAGELQVLVATDIAARGIDVDGISHVVNYDLPNVPETYVHRIGRTARAGNDGIAISFCDAEERAFLRDIEKTIRQQVAVDADHPFHAAHIADNVRGGGAHAGQRVRGGNRGKPQRHGSNRSAEDRGGQPERADRGQQRGRHANGEQPHGRDMRRTDAGSEGRHRESNGHHAHGGEPRQHSHGRDGRRPDAARDGGDRHRGSNGHRQHTHSAEPREQGHRQDQRHEPRKSADGGHKTQGQRPQGKQHARQDNGGQQPLKRTNRGERGNAHSGGGRPQRLEPVRMR
jgi:ATP-dependent RNA helicase RhlE